MIGRVLLLALLPIGDTLLTTPTIRALRARYPSARLVALAHANAAPILRCVPALDETVVLPTGPDWRGPRHLAATLRQLRAEHFQVAVDFTSPTYKWISLVCGIRRRTYMKFDPLWWILPGQHHRWRTTHAAQHYYECASELDLPDWHRVNQSLSLALPPPARARAHSFLQQHPGRFGVGPLVGIHVGGAGLGGLKRWPVERFAELGNYLIRRWDARCVLLGGPDEFDVARQVSQGLHCKPLWAMGCLGLLETFALIQACDLFIGNDSSLLHAAAGLGVPYVGIFGPTSPDSFRPLPATPSQGKIVQPMPACHEQQAFVGSHPLWTRPRCVGECAALANLETQMVAACADRLLERRASHRTAA